MIKARITSLRLHNFCSSLLDANAIVVDLGANRGYFSHGISQLYGCRAYAVEASPELFASIHESALVRKFNYAIAGEDKPLQFHLSTNEESGSIKDLPDNLTDDRFVTVQGITLNSFLKENNIDRVDLLKVDIEGAEVELFDSTSDETLKKIGQIAVEFHDFLDYFEFEDEIKKIENRLKKLGFYYISFSIFSHANVLFINQNTGISKLDYLYLNYVDKYWRALIRGISWRLRKLLGMKTPQTALGKAARLALTDTLESEREQLLSP
jgi:FkbM family methyltransferase